MPRPRLFRRLDALHRRGGALWVHGVPGGGKTTLLASWLEARRHRAVWVKVDEGDADLATFFHYLAAAARGSGRRTPPLPVPAPEHLERPEVFARNFFRALHAALPRGTVLVLDDLQEAGAALHGVLRALLEERPAGAAVVLSSRGAPPARLARSRAAGDLGVLGGSELDLTEREVRALARQRGFPGDPRPVVAGAGGWPAGVVLRLEAGHAGGRARSPEDELFTGEALERLSPPERRTLVEAALLLPATAELVAQATGDPGAGPLLASLAERGLFTVSHHGTPPVYEFHALFRAFLLARAERELSPERRAEVRRAAALALADQPGAAPEAVFPLLAQAGAFEEAARLVAREAGPLLDEGRWRTVEGWLAALPAPLREADPWLLHWGGVAAVGRSPAEAQRRLDRAFALFEAAGDGAGLWLAWAARVDAAVAAWSSFEPLERALADLARLRPRLPPQGEGVERRVVLAACLAATLAAPEHPDLPAWAEAVREIASAPNPAVLRLVAGGELALLDGCVLGEVERSAALARELGALADGERVPEAVAQRWRCLEAQVEFVAGRFDACAAVAERALADAARLGLHLGDYFCRALLFQVALTREPAAVPGRLRAMERALRPGISVDAANFRLAEAMAALRRGDTTRAQAHLDAARKLSLEARHVMGSTLSLMLLARLRARTADPEGARVALAAVRAWAERARSGWGRCVTAFLEAEVLLREERLAEAAAPLAEGFRLTEETGVHPFLILDLAEGARLCDAALAAGLDDAPVRRFAQRWRLDPPPPAAAHAPELWPWPVRIRVLGPLRVERDGAAVGGSGRIPRKPLELLRLLASQGGREVDEHVATASLWPDADGDAAHHALETTVYRLRRLLGADAVVQRDRKLSLARRRCWVDAFEVEERLARGISAQERRRDPLADGPGLARDAARICDLYQGPLLADAEGEWARPPRERLRRRLARWLDALPPGGERDASAVRAELQRRDPEVCGAGKTPGS